MTLILTQSDWEELCQQTSNPPKHLLLDDFEEFVGVPESIGHGYSRGMELSPGIWLSLLDRQFHQDWILQTPAHDHLIQIGIFLSGFLYFDDVYPNLGGRCGYFSGSGISPAYMQKHRGGQRLMIVNVEIEPELMNSFFLDQQPHSDHLKLLIKAEDWKVSFYPTVTPAMRALAQQLWNAPYCGAAKRIYLQAKVLELLAMHLNWLTPESSNRQLKPNTVDCIHYAKDILLANLEQPPSVLELAQQVGVSERTLQRGFRALFGTTVFGYLTEQRMALAEQWLRQGNSSITEVATMSGYSNPGHFSAAFKRKFGITPSECMLGKKSVLRSSMSVLE